MSEKRLRLIIADDHELILNAVRGLLENQYEVIGTAKNGRVLVDSALNDPPDLIIADVSMPVLNGIDAAHEIRTQLPQVRFVFLSMHANPIYLRRAMTAGAFAYVLKSEAAEDLIAAVESVRKGRHYISPGFGQDLSIDLIEWLRKPARATVHLTARQRQILQLIAEGRRNKEIAELVGISVKTVEFHRGRLISRLGAHSAVELTKCAIEEGLVTLPRLTHKRNR